LGFRSRFGFAWCADEILVRQPYTDGRINRLCLSQVLRLAACELVETRATLIWLLGEVRVASPTAPVTKTASRFRETVAVISKPADKHKRRARSPAVVFDVILSDSSTASSIALTEGLRYDCGATMMFDFGWSRKPTARCGRRKLGLQTGSCG
jgi:hypothetical protein